MMWTFPPYLSDGRTLNKRSLVVYILFHHEISHLFVENRNILDECLEHTVKDVDEMKTMFSDVEAFDGPAFCRMTRIYISTMIRNADDGLKWLLEYIKINKPELADQMFGANIDASSGVFQAFQKYFLLKDKPSVLEDISDFLNTDEFIDTLEHKMKDAPFFAEIGQHQDLLQKHDHNSQSLNSSDPAQHARALCHEPHIQNIFLRNLAKCNASSGDSDDWVLELMALWGNKLVNCHALHNFMNNYKVQLEARKLENAYQAQNLIGEDELEQSECRGQEVSNSSVYAKWYENNLHKQDVPAITLRAYQRELVHDAIQGHNVMIAAHEGCGKTHIACEIAGRHLESRFALREEVELLHKAGNPADPEFVALSKARVVFIVPAASLVEKQLNSFRAVLKERYICVGLHQFMEVDKNDTQQSLFLGAHLIVTTPQYLINVLKSVRRENRIYTMDITMIILDECQRVTEHNAYNSLLNIIKASNANPQIVGMTTSLGIERKRCLSEVSDDVYATCALLNAYNFVFVKTNQDEYDKCVQLLKDSAILCKRQSSSEHTFESKLIGMIQRVEASVLKSLMYFDDYDFFKKRSKLNICHCHPEEYLCLVHSLLLQIPKSHPNPLLTDALSRDLRALMIFIKYAMFEELVPSKYVVQLLIHSIKSEKLFTYWSDELDELKASAEDEDLQNKKILVELRDLLAQQLSTNARSRIVIFVKHRAVAYMLAECLNEDSFFSAINDSGKIAQACHGDCTESVLVEQPQAIKKFQDGDLPILISTPLVKDGLDLKLCDIVVKYNMAELTAAEQKHRASFCPSDLKLSLLIATKDVRDMEAAVLYRKMLTLSVFKNMAQIDASYFNLVCTQLRYINDEERAATSNAEHELESNAQMYTIKCMRCRATLGCSTEMRTILNQRYVLCNNFWENIYFEPLQKARTVCQLVMMVGKAFCANRIKDMGRCGEYLGTVNMFADTFFFQLRAYHVHLCNEKEILIYYYWAHVKANLFNIPEISMSDLLDVEKNMPSQVRYIFLEALVASKNEARIFLQPQRIQNKELFTESSLAYEWYLSDEEEDEPSVVRYRSEIPEITL